MFLRSISVEIPDDIRRSEARLAAHVDTVARTSIQDITHAIDASAKVLERHMANLSVSAAQAVIERILISETRQQVAHKALMANVGRAMESQDRQLQELNALLRGFGGPTSPVSNGAIVSARGGSQAVVSTLAKPTSYSSMSRSVCHSLCRCSCHSVKSYKWSYAGLEQILGTIKISFAGTVLRQKTCSDRRCRNQNRQGRLAAHYTFPAWATTAMVSLFFARLPQPEFLLRVYRHLPLDQGKAEYQESIFRAIFMPEPEASTRVRGHIAARSSCVSDIGGSGYSPCLYAAVSQGGASTIRLLLQAGADPFQETRLGDTAIACTFRWFLKGSREAEALLEIMPLERYLDLQEYTDFHRVVAGLLPITVKEALLNPVFRDDIDTSNLEGWTPLHLAALRSDSLAVRALLEAGADVTPRETATGGYSPFLCACDQADDDTIGLLLQHGAEANSQDAYKNGSLHLICGNQKTTPKSLKRLLDDNPEINVSALGCLDHTAPLIAADRPAFLHVLIEHGADLNVPDFFGMTALGRCVTFGHHSSADMLLRAGAEYASPNATGRTMLHLLALNGDEKMMDVFASFGMGGVDMDLRDDKGMTALDVLESERKHVTPELRATFRSLLDTIRAWNARDGSGTGDLHESDSEFVDALEDLDFGD